MLYINFQKPDHPPVAPKPELPKLEKPKTKELDGYVGFANLPNQVYRKAVKKGFEFTLMVVGKLAIFNPTLAFTYHDKNLVRVVTIVIKIRGVLEQVHILLTVLMCNLLRN